MSYTCLYDHVRYDATLHTSGLYDLHLEYCINISSFNLLSVVILAAQWMRQAVLWQAL